MEERAEVESESVEVLGLFLIFPRTVPRSVSKDWLDVVVVAVLGAATTVAPYGGLLDEW